MSMDQFFDILRIVLLVIQLISAGATVFIVVIKGRVNIAQLLSKLMDWYKKAYEDGKITAEEITEAITIVKELSDMSENKKASTETKEDK